MARGNYGTHIWKEHWKGKEKWISCFECRIYYATFCAFVFYIWKIYNKRMSDLVTWVLLIIGVTVPVVVGALFNYFLNKKKVQAETESIQLKNKITKDITYDQLKTESKQKDIKGKIEIFRSLTKLEEEIKSRENKTASDQKKLESLEMIKKEFKQSFGEREEETQLVEPEKSLEVKEKQLSKTTKKSLKKRKI